LEQRRAAEKECRFRQDSLRAEYATANGRKTSLETMIAQHGYSTESVKRLLQSDARPAFAPAGVLADFLEVDDQYEAVVEDFLRDELNYVVVKSWDAADEGLRLLQSDVDGRATFLVHPEDAQAKFSFIRDERNSASPRRGAILPLKNCIKVLNGFGKSLEVILPKLGNGYITPDRDSAREMALENPNAFFLAPTGETFHNVTVTGGRQRLEGPLSMKRELRELARITSQLEESLRKEEIKRVELARAISELEALGERLQSEGREVEKILLGAGNTLQQLDSELLRARQQLELSQAELARLEGEAVEVAKKLESEKAQEAAHEQSKQRLEREFSEAQKKLLELREKEQVAAREAAEAAAQLAAMEERHHAATASLERIAAMAGECRNRVMALEQEIAAASAEQGQRLSENQQITTQLQSLEASRTDLHRKGEELRQQSLQIKAAMQTLQNGLRELRQQLDGLRDRRGELSSRQAKLESDVAHLSESCLNELNLSRAELLADASIPVLQGEGLAAEETAQRELRARLEAMGPVNMMALEEYNEIAQRHEFLETQRKDLLESIDNTQASIRELDSVTREKFEAAFNRINENFQFTFRKLFGGGQAFMRLTDQENSPDSGIDVIASPPGKKLQNVLLLSGGEKALTALALLVAIFQYQPSPFCLLDEVDAPLDEANVGRFTEMVRELSGTTQFILITHNKRTMSVAPVLYGITMQEQGVSKMVSVRFGEAAQAATA
jgi:chromosome segregation protein